MLPAPLVRHLPRADDLRILAPDLVADPAGPRQRTKRRPRVQTIAGRQPETYAKAAHLGDSRRRQRDEQVDASDLDARKWSPQPGHSRRYFPSRPRLSIATNRGSAGWRPQTTTADGNGAESAQPSDPHSRSPSGPWPRVGFFAVGRACPLNTSRPSTRQTSSARITQVCHQAVPVLAGGSATTRRQLPDHACSAQRSIQAAIWL